MDSGNSGSMQSSSGGDEEYDSRAESSVPAAFLNPPTHFGSMSNHQSIFFDLSSANYIHAFSQSQPNSNHPNSLLHLDAVQSRGGLRSEANCTDLGNLPGSSSSAQSILGSHQGLHQGSSSTTMQLRPVGHDNGGRASAQPNVVRNSKKRTRASRRAPTTVLTTDTSNFRAMVQEFTGIPAPPFSGSSYSRRLDLFGSSSGGLRSGHLEPMGGGGGLYPLRPSAQKVIQPSPFSSSSSLLNNAMGIDATNIASTTANNNFNSTLNNLGLHKQPQNMLNMQNPLLTFQPLPHPQASSSLQHPSLNVPGFMTRSQGSLTVPISLEELGISHGHVNANLGGMPNDGSTSQDHLRSSLDGNYGNSPRVGGCKLNYSAANSSSNFSHDKALENVSARGEGTVDSWLCPSD